MDIVKYPGRKRRWCHCWLAKPSGLFDIRWFPTNPVNWRIVPESTPYSTDQLILTQSRKGMVRQASQGIQALGLIVCTSLASYNSHLLHQSTLGLDTVGANPVTTSGSPPHLTAFVLVSA